jgi:hypothetical protein
MNIVSSLTSKQLRRAAEIKEQLEKLNAELNSLFGATTAKPATTSGKGKMSPAGRAKVAAAQKARWAKIKAAKGPAAVKPAKKARKPMSAAGRAKISAAAKARWAKVNAAKAKK